MNLGRDLTGLATPSRYYYIAKEFARQAFTFGKWQEFGPVPFNPVPLLAGYFFCFGISLRPREKVGAAASVLALALTLGGYFCVYLLTPHALALQMMSSCDRLFLQLWPSIVFICFMALPSPTGQAPIPKSE